MEHRYARIHAVNGCKQIYTNQMRFCHSCAQLWNALNVNEIQRSRHWRRRVFRFENHGEKQNLHQRVQRADISASDCIFGSALKGRTGNAGVTTMEIVRFYFLFSQVSHVATLELPLLMLGRAVGWLVSVRTVLILLLLCEFHSSSSLSSLSSLCLSLRLWLLCWLPFFCRRCGDRLCGLSKYCLSIFW